MLVGIWLGLRWVLFYFFDHYIKRVEVIDFRLFRATELAFAIRPKDGVARQGRRGGFHCYCPKACWNNLSVVVRVRGRATGLVFASCPIFKVQLQGGGGGGTTPNLGGGGWVEGVARVGRRCCTGG